MGFLPFSGVFLPFVYVLRLPGCHFPIAGTLLLPQQVGIGVGSRHVARPEFNIPANGAAAPPPGKLGARGPRLVGDANLGGRHGVHHQ